MKVIAKQLIVVGMATIQEEKNGLDKNVSGEAGDGGRRRKGCKVR